MMRDYPSHWWSFAIAGCIFFLCIGIFYRLYICHRQQQHSMDDDDEYLIVDDPQNETTKIINTPPIESSNAAALKKLFRLNEHEDEMTMDEDGYTDINAKNTSIVSIGSFHQKQSSLYQSFNLHPRPRPTANRKYYFHQLAAYNSANIDDDEDETRIEAMKEMCQQMEYYSDSDL